MTETEKRMTGVKTFFLLGLAIGLGACDKDKVFQTGFGSIQQKPIAAQSAINSSNAEMDLSQIVAARGIFKMEIKPSKLDITPCTGEVQLNIMKSMMAQFASQGANSMNCFGITFDAKNLLPPLPKVEAAANNNDQVADPGDGYFFRAAKIGNTTFTPSRPFILGPVVQDPQKYLNYHEEKDYTATVTAADGTTKSYSGKIAVQVLEINAKFKPEQMDQELDRVIKWQMSASGFDGLDHGGAFAFPKYEMWWNTRPLAIVKLIIEDSGPQFMGAKLPSGVKDILQSTSSLPQAILGLVHVEFTLKKLESSVDQ